MAHVREERLMGQAPPGRFTAVIGDLVQSSDDPHRAASQERLLAGIDELDARWRSQRVVAVSLTAGDEVQALLEPGRAGLAVEVVRSLTDALRAPPDDSRARLGLPIRFGLGFCRLSTGPADREARVPTSPALLDGPCFRRPPRPR